MLSSEKVRMVAMSKRLWRLYDGLHRLIVLKALAVRKEHLHVSIDLTSD